VQWFDFANWFVLRAALVVVAVAIVLFFLKQRKPFNERANARLQTTLVFGIDLAVASNALSSADAPAVALLTSAAWATWLVIWSTPRFRQNQITSTFDIRCSPELVFTFISDSRNLPRWRTECETVAMLTPEPIGPGTRFRQSGRLPGGMEIVGTEQIVGYEPYHRLTSRVEWNHPNLEKITFEQVGAATRVTTTSDLEYSFGEAVLGAKLFRGAGIAKVMALREAGVVRIKQILEPEFDR
jgi:uncharacterized protein YndB with AHSA1/START domain